MGITPADDSNLSHYLRRPHYTAGFDQRFSKLLSCCELLIMAEVLQYTLPGITPDLRDDVRVVQSTSCTDKAVVEANFGFFGRKVQDLIEELLAELWSCRCVRHRCAVGGCEIELILLLDYK